MQCSPARETYSRSAVLENHLQSTEFVNVFTIYDPEPHLSRFKQVILPYTGLFISPSGISEIDCATTKTDTAETSISIGRESLQVFFFVLGALAYFHIPSLRGSREEKWRSQ